MTTPADELRAAAKELREYASTASPAPWAVNQCGNVETSGHEEMAEVWPLQAAPGANATYIALMGPDVGHALAQWLDYHAGMSDRLAQLFDDPPLIPDDHPALAVARALIGEAR
ncbi:hypothetical protein [Streptomyces lateritius]|uniref:hypothetical protein n=1 Tax=Streptomyces lateritius TaxID=67313 RepID=UPI001C8B4AF6|nr:hypothetical protein [Streptomyces lateritius]MBX9425470.1 hypothetical protein [Streptomyces lateritius]